MRRRLRPLRIAGVPLRSAPTAEEFAYLPPSRVGDIPVRSSGFTITRTM
jgi:hypothetical protein